MLVNYRDEYKKIAMGLLSFIPELKDLSHLNSEMAWYQQSANRPMYLWRNADEHLIGIVCLEIGDEYVLIRRLSFTPSDRTGRNIFALLNAVHDKYSEKKLVGTMETQPLITNWGKTLNG
jgi:riboflavin biosynthesis RibT protein